MTNPPLPERTRLFYIGPPKTGTTAVQAAGAACRPELLRHGVLYPGVGVNHRREVNAFLERGFGWRVEGERASAAPGIGAWTNLVDEIRGERERRVWFGHEYAASATDEQAKRWRDELNPRLHIALTLRPYAKMLPSMWQETLKRNAGRTSLEHWLRGVLKPGKVGQPDRRVKYDHAALIERWSRLVGPENVSVVVLDPADHSFSFRAFEDMLGLPADMLVDAAPGGRSVNRSLTVPEAEMLRRLNGVLRDGGLEWANHEWLVYFGAIGRFVQRTPAPDEPKLTLPGWAFDLAREQEDKVVRTIETSGVRVMGDPQLLLSGPQTGEYVDHRSVETVPVDLAIEALAGSVAVATGRTPEFQRTPEALRRKASRDVTQNLPQILQVIGLRGFRRVRRAPAAIGRRVADASRKVLPPSLGGTRGASSD